MNPFSTLTTTWTDGMRLSVAEIVLRYGIPREEVTAFQQTIRVYPGNSVIIREGAVDRSLYLVRTGKVGVYRQVNERAEQIAMIEAINFVGEMSLINDEPRSATVVAESDEVVVYTIARPNLGLILANPKWAEALVTRLSKNLAQNNDHLMSATRTIETLQAENKALRRERDGLLANAGEALSAVLHFQQKVQGQAIVESRGWHYLNILNRVTRALIEHYLPQVGVDAGKADERVIQRCLGSARLEGHPGLVDELERP